MKKLLRVIFGSLACLAILIAYSVLRVAMAWVFGIENRSLGTVGETVLVLVVVLMPMLWVWRRIATESGASDPPITTNQSKCAPNPVPIPRQPVLGQTAKPKVPREKRRSEASIYAWAATISLLVVGAAVWIVASDRGVGDAPWATVEHPPLTEEETRKIGQKRLHNLALHEERKVEKERKERLKLWDKILNPDEETRRYLEMRREMREPEKSPPAKKAPISPFFQGKPPPPASTPAPPETPEAAPQEPTTKPRGRFNA